MAGLFYLGNANGLDELHGPVPPNTDDSPVIEFIAPRLRAEGRPPLVGHALLPLVAPLSRAAPSQADPVLERFPAQERQYVLAGTHLHWYHVFRSARMPDSANAALARATAVLARLSRPPDRAWSLSLLGTQP